jgi:hypothetical protein
MKKYSLPGPYSRYEYDSTRTGIKFFRKLVPKFVDRPFTSCYGFHKTKYRKTYFNLFYGLKFYPETKLSPYLKTSDGITFWRTK